MRNDLQCISGFVFYLQKRQFLNSLPVLSLDISFQHVTFSIIIMNYNLAVSTLDLWSSKIWGVDGQYWALTTKLSFKSKNIVKKKKKVKIYVYMCRLIFPLLDVIHVKNNLASMPVHISHYAICISFLSHKQQLCNKL